MSALTEEIEFTFVFGFKNKFHQWKLHYTSRVFIGFIDEKSMKNLIKLNVIVFLFEQIKTSFF
jgi:hypothetical protein